MQVFVFGSHSVIRLVQHKSRVFQRRGIMCFRLVMRVTRLRVAKRSYCARDGWSLGNKFQLSGFPIRIRWSRRIMLLTYLMLIRTYDYSVLLARDSSYFRVLPRRIMPGEQLFLSFFSFIFFYLLPK